MNARRLEGIRALVVEDSYIVAMSAADMLESEGANVVAVLANVADALASIDAHADALDVVLLDVNLAGEISCAVAHALRAHAIPFLLITGYDAAALDPCFDGVPLCPKPFNHPVMVAEIQRVHAKRMSSR